MKKSDIATIVLIAGISVLVAYFVAKAVIGDPETTSVNVKTAVPIISTIQQPSAEIFNNNAINPTVELEIGTEAPASSSTDTTPTSESDDQGNTNTDENQ